MDGMEQAQGTFRVTSALIQDTGTGRPLCQFSKAVTKPISTDFIQLFHFVKREVWNQFLLMG